MMVPEGGLARRLDDMHAINAAFLIGTFRTVAVTTQYIGWYFKEPCHRAEVFCGFFWNLTTV